MNCLKTYYERQIGDYIITADTMYNGYSGDEESSVSVFSLTNGDEVETIDCDFTELFKVFCDTCRKYNA